ncbi:YceI family protein [Acetobacter indonesiensis]|uniref:YceI family protein n=1 Tax=Acetobacter indonesiensis TaxID=104101 RepID=UPI0020A465C0|nr:YceI family protein [Acetobacter indonesiensis]MCP1231893.1 YceI family protein [Acetobacter indonesiensis]
MMGCADREMGRVVSTCVRALAGWSVALTVFITTSHAAGVSSVMARSPLVEAGRYHVDTLRSQIVFSVSCLGTSQYRGLFSGVYGDLQLDPQNPEKSHVALKLPLASLATTAVDVSRMLRGENWFNAKAFPIAEFVSTEIHSNGASMATVSGNLTLHGVTRPVTLRAHFVGAGQNPINHSYDVGFEAQGTIQRSAFGLTNAMVAVGDDVTLTVSGVFEKDE